MSQNQFMIMLCAHSHHVSLEEKSILKLQIEFMGIVCNCGKVDVLIDKDDVYLPKEKKEQFFLNMILQNRMNDDFDTYFGPVKYMITERNNLKFISIPVSSGLIFAIMKKSSEHTTFVNDILLITNHTKEELIKTETLPQECNHISLS